MKLVVVVVGVVVLWALVVVVWVGVVVLGIVVDPMIVHVIMHIIVRVKGMPSRVDGVVAFM